MRLHLIFVLVGLATASPVVQGSSSPSERSNAIETDDFKPDWDAIEADYKAASIRFAEEPTLSKRLNTQGAMDVSYAQAIWSAGDAALKQVKSISKWKKARGEFTKLCTQIMMDHNPNSTQAVSAICYNKDYDIKNPDGIYGMTSQTLSIWPAKTNYDCFYMGRNNTFWSWGDGGTINLYTRWYEGACRFDDQSDLYC
ncbi:hypothetical protein LY76DRAFT_629750, partial [Colletotrichum caudatum]